MKSVSWQPKFEWCNLFCRLVYAEAFYGGNAIPSLSSPSVYSSVDNFVKNSYGTYTTSLKNQEKGKYVHDSRGAIDFAVGNTVWNTQTALKVGNRFVDLAGDKTDLHKEIYANLTKKYNLLKEFKKKKAILPGDLVIFDWGGDLVGGIGKEKGAQHIGIYLGGDSGLELIDGNFGSRVGYRKENILPIRGIVQLSTVESP